MGGVVLQYDAVSRLGISEPEQFLRRKYREQQQLFLHSCLLGPALLAQIGQPLVLGVNWHKMGKRRKEMYTENRNNKENFSE
jgi:hypothetical protein